MKPERTEPIPMKAGDKRVMVNGEPVQVDFRIISEELYQELSQSSPVESKWVSVKERLPAQGKRVIWRAVCKWMSKNNASFFDDELTGETEALEYGGIGYRIKDNSDYLAVPHDTDYWDDILTDWLELPIEETKEK